VKVKLRKFEIGVVLTLKTSRNSS